MTPEQHKEAILLAAQEQALRHADAMEHGPSNAFQEAHDALIAAVEAALSQAEANRADAERYRWLRKQDWFDGELCVLRNPKEVLRRGSALGADCPSRSRLDEAIDILTNAVKTKG